MNGTGPLSPPSPSGTTSATRVADVLLCLAAADRPLGVTELARQLALSKAVAHRILRSLADRELVRGDRASGTYRLGPAAAAIGARALADSDLRAAALPVLRRLQADTGETATVSELVGAQRVYLAQVESVQQVRMSVELGRPYPLHAGASSRAILAAADARLREEVLAGELPRLTDATVGDRPALEQELASVARDGVAVSYGERQHGAASVAAAVEGADGAVIGAISVCGPIGRFDTDVVDGLRALVRTAGEDVSRALATPWAEGGEAGR